MAEPLTNPHDRFFKEVFSRQETARDFLQHYLPSEVVHLLDFTSLEISKDSFIDPDLQEHFSDLLYKVALHNKQETFIYILFEHKSYPERQIALQLLRYMVKIWDQALKQDQKLLPVLSIVVYHGRVRWTIAPNFAALFKIPEALKRYVPEYQYWLCDLTQYSDAEIQGEVILRVILLLLKYMMRDDLRQHLNEILSLLTQLEEQQTGLEYLETILRYLSRGTEKITQEELRQAVSEVFTEGEKLMPTIAEQWIEQGRQQGLEQGLEQGLIQGRQQGHQEMILHILQRRFGELPAELKAKIDQLEAKQLVELMDLVLETASLASIEAFLTRHLAGKQTNGANNPA